MSSSPSITSLDPGVLIPLAELPKYIPPGRNGKKRHKSACYRWASRGVRGIRLATEQLPDGQYVTPRAWSDFVGQLTRRRAGRKSPAPAVTPRQQNKHQNAVEQEIEAVRANLRKKGGA